MEVVLVAAVALLASAPVLALASLLVPWKAQSCEGVGLIRSAASVASATAYAPGSAYAVLCGLYVGCNCDYH